MPRTKTQTSTKKKKKNTSPKKSETEDGNPTRPKRLTMKQIRERKKLILETIQRVNDEFLEEKKNYLKDKEHSESSHKRKVSFNSLVKFSNGDEMEVEFTDGETAKQLMGFNAAPTTITIEPPVTRNKRKTNNMELVEESELKRVKKNK